MRPDPPEVQDELGYHVTFFPPPSCNSTGSIRDGVVRVRGADRSGRRLGPSGSASARTWSRASSCPAGLRRNPTPPPSCPSSQALKAGARKTGGVRRALTRASCRTSACAFELQPPSCCSWQDGWRNPSNENDAAHCQYLNGCLKQSCRKTYRSATISWISGRWVMISFPEPSLRGLDPYDRDFLRRVGFRVPPTPPEPHGGEC